jgi:hemolysin activation/secretion protein
MTPRRAVLRPRAAAAALLVAFAAALAGAGPAAAQSVPDPTNPGRILERFRDLRRIVPKPGLRLPASPKAKRRLPKIAPFTLRMVELRGVSVYPLRTLARLYEDRIGKRVEAKDVLAIVDAIARRYRRDGWALVSVALPKQGFEDGRLRIKVTEGFVSKVVIRGTTDRTKNLGLLREYGERIARDRPLRQATLERYLLLAADIPGLKVGSRFEPNPKVPGSAILVLTLLHEPYNIILGIDNYGSSTLGPYQLQFGAGQNGVLSLGDVTRAQYSMTPRWGELHYFDLMHSFPLSAEGTRAHLDVFHVRSRPQLLDLRGRATGGRVGVGQAFQRSLRNNFTASVFFDVLDTQSYLAKTKISEDRLRNVRLSGVYSGLDDANGSTVLAATLSRGLAGLGAESNSTPYSRANFTKVNLSARRIQVIASRLSLVASVAGQYAAVALPVPERFGYGGRFVGRAFDPSATTGDHGLAATTELRFAPPDIAAGPFSAETQLYVFGDWGRVWNRSPMAQPVFRMGASAGAGLRATVMKYVSGGIEIAFPVYRSGSSHDPADYRIMMNLKLRYGK